MKSSISNLAFGLALAGLLTATGVTHAGQGPWDRTETRTDCTDFNDLRTPFFGDTHVHTAYSADAVINGTTNEPRDAYDFAKGGSLPYTSGNPVATAQLLRPLDFSIVTDHAEFFGENQICLDPLAEPGYSSTECTAVRADIGVQFDGPLDATSFLAFFVPTQVPNTPRWSWCGLGGADCLAAASLIWQDTQDSAEEHYDRSAACSFTSMIGYEWTGNTDYENLHRNVIFRNEIVQTLPTSYYEEPTALGLWGALESECLDAGSGCDLLAIPHNSNISGGSMWLDPGDAETAILNARIEPVVEITQHKGDSECHPDFSNNPALFTTDELCGYEKLGIGNLTPFISPLKENFTRNALLEGLAFEASLGINPFKFGVIGSTDGHMAMSGNTREDSYRGHVGAFDEEPRQRLLDFSAFHAGSGPGGLAVLYAEENSRDALFSAMRRREVYSTTGTRPIVRFFGGKLSKKACDDGTVIENGYTKGVPMGGELGAAGKPLFTVMATKDPGPMGFPGTDLQRLQIVKGWVDSAGTKWEKVYDVAGDPDNGAGVDLATCTPTGTGFDSLCATWSDPDFNKSERAFYYARAVDNPTCRYTTYICNDEGVDCSDLPSVPEDFELCCDANLELTVQERAVTSPIFYRPEAIAKLKAKLSYGCGHGGGCDKLKMSVQMGATHADFDIDTNDLDFSLRDDDTIYAVNIPAGTLVASKPGKYSYKDDLGSLGGLRKLKLIVASSGKIKLKLQTIEMDFTNADLSDHMIHFDLSIGQYETSHRRRWINKDNKFLSTS